MKMWVFVWGRYIGDVVLEAKKETDILSGRKIKYF
jgi:hypothetical protein